jgi:hypothetical protein
MSIGPRLPRSSTASAKTKAISITIFNDKVVMADQETALQMNPQSSLR